MFELILNFILLVSFGLCGEDLKKLKNEEYQVRKEGYVNLQNKGLISVPAIWYCEQYSTNPEMRASCSRLVNLKVRSPLYNNEHYVVIFFLTAKGYPYVHQELAEKFFDNESLREKMAFYSILLGVIGEGEISPFDKRMRKNSLGDRKSQINCAQGALTIFRSRMLNSHLPGIHNKTKIRLLLPEPIDFEKFSILPKVY